MLASTLPLLLAALAKQVVSLPRSLLMDCNVISHNQRPKMQITDCYENLKSALIKSAMRIIGQPLKYTDRQALPTVANCRLPLHVILGPLDIATDFKGESRLIDLQIITNSLSQFTQHILH